MIDDMADAGGTLLRLLNGALDISRIESGRVDVRLAPVDIGERVRSIARVWGARVEELGLTLEVELQGAPENFIVLTDEARIEQILINYLSNALKMTPAGDLRILARALPAPDGRIDLEFEVHDRGPGVPDDQRDRIFQPFEQLAAGRAAGGSGLDWPSAAPAPPPWAAPSASGPASPTARSSGSVWRPSARALPPLRRRSPRRPSPGRPPAAFWRPRTTPPTASSWPCCSSRSASNWCWSRTVRRPWTPCGTALSTWC